jgi:hypothetical protein
MMAMSNKALMRSDKLFLHAVKIHPGVPQEDMICGWQ